MPAGPWVVKFGGELLEPGARLDASVAAIMSLAASRPLVVVHGGGKEIDAEASRRGLARQSVDGLRITDAPTLATVVAVLAGTINTRLVARLVAAGVKAVGLTGADAGAVPVARAAPHRALDGRLVDLGLVGEPDAARADPALVAHLVAAGYVPVMACIAADADGVLYNVNADTLAAHLAAALAADRLIFGGATAGVLDEAGGTIATLDLGGIEALVGSGTASAGMVAKLRAARYAIEAGVVHVAILDGRDGLDPAWSRGTRIGRSLGAMAVGER